MSASNTSNAETAYSEAVEKAAAFSLTRAESYIVEGPDALRYAHGRTTQNVRELKPGDSAQFMLLEPKGRLQSFGRLAKLDDKLLVLAETDVENSFSEDFLRFKVADQLQLNSLAETHQILYILGPALGLDAGNPLANIFSDIPLDRATRIEYNDTEIYCIPACDLRLPGYFIISPKKVSSILVEDLKQKAKISTYSDLEFEITRISLKMPSASCELKEKCIATDYPFQPYISFTKGCYTGQEVVEMSTARGRPNRRLVLLHLDSQQPVEVGTKLSTAPSSQSNTSIGKITSSVYIPSLQQVRCLAFIKNSTDISAKVFIGEMECNLVNLGD